MNQWYATLALLAVMQIWFYRVDVRKAIVGFLFYWGSVYLGLLSSEFASRVLIEFEIEWWIPVMVCLASVAIGETAEVLAASVGKSVEKRRQSLPSIFTFSNLYLALVWLSLWHHPLLHQSQIEMMAIATFSFLFLIILCGIRNRLALYDIPRYLRELPIVMITAALFLLIFLR